MLIATFVVPSEAITLDYTLSELPEIDVEAERIAAHSTRWTMPCLWVASSDFDAVDETLAADPSVKSVVGTEQFAEEKYYQIEWTETIEERINSYIDQQGSIIHAKASAEGWEVKFRFVSRNQFDAFREQLAEEGHSFELLKLVEPGAPRVSTAGVTPVQRDALAAAHEHGYFEVPREITMRELADELEMSHQSLSEVIRRGTNQLIDTSLTTDGDIESR